MSARNEALRIEIRGVVQGVGFRPTVYRLAQENSLNGWVRNDNQGLTIHVEGEASRLAAFVAALRDKPPPGSRMTAFEVSAAVAGGFVRFEIRHSLRAGSPVVMISADLPVCDACLTEMRDPNNRRYRYPYINCTACGPRYSIIRSLPYDRGNTTMADWPMCPECQGEYDDPGDRRHHAQPTACPRCGPNYRLIDEERALATGIEAISLAARLLTEGQIVAVKGIGGYHLACSARDEAAVRRLRERKFRKEKPFAVMVRNLATAERLAWLNDSQRSLLDAPARPIVLASARFELGGVSGDTDEIGLMLPYAPLHHLLFDLGAPDPLVMTSANRSSEPIAYRDEDAFRRLTGIADVFLVGERPIARRVDDSVVAVRGGGFSVLRRSRGLAPATVARLTSERPILAVGADLKSSLTLVVSGEAIGSQHIGDLGDLETNRAFEKTIGDLLAMYDVDPRGLIVAYDKHPDYVSTRVAARLSCRGRVMVQHHRAHIASVMAERGERDRPVVGLALDGTGYGDDGAIWGFEVFGGSVLSGFERVAHLRPALLPGGDAAARFPAQAAAGFLTEIDVPDLRQPPFSLPDRFFDASALVARRVRCFETTSAGRLFDTVAALCGFDREIRFEGQAAVWLENLARGVADCQAYDFPDLDYRPLLAAIIADRRSGRDVGEISYRFHAAIAQALATTALAFAGRFSTQHVALSGGVFQNRLLRAMLEDRSGAARDLRFLYNEAVPANDGGISLGQAAMACAASQGQ